MDLPINLDLSPVLAWPDTAPKGGDGAPCPCAALIAEARGGSQDAFRALVDRHQDAIHSFCFRWLENAEDAREACQDTFVRAWTALPRYRRQGRFSAWLFRIALNLCRDRHRSKARRQQRSTRSLDESDGDFPCSRPGPDESASQASDLAKLDRGIRLLSEHLRAPLLLCCLEGLSHQECAQVLKCSPRAVEGRIYRARRELLDWWKRTA